MMVVSRYTDSAMRGDYRRIAALSNSAGGCRGEDGRLRWLSRRLPGFASLFSDGYARVPERPGWSLVARSAFGGCGYSGAVRLAARCPSRDRPIASAPSVSFPLDWRFRRARAKRPLAASTVQ